MEAGDHCQNCGNESRKEGWGRQTPIFLSFPQFTCWERELDTAAEAHLAGTEKRKVEDRWGGF